MYTNLSRFFVRFSKELIIGGALGFALSLTFSFFLSAEYRADAQIYIISKARYGVDPYTVSKSAERIGESLSGIMKTSDFYEAVLLNQNVSFDKSYFENIPQRKKRERWSKSVESGVVYGTGILNVSVYHKTPEESVLFSRSVLDTLIHKGTEYVGDDVEIKLLNEPLATRFPARPNYVMNAILGFFAGIIAMAMVLFWKK